MMTRRPCQGFGFGKGHKREVQYNVQRTTYITYNANANVNAGNEGFVRRRKISSNFSLPRFSGLWSLLAE